MRSNLYGLINDTHVIASNPFDNTQRQYIEYSTQNLQPAVLDIVCKFRDKEPKKFQKYIHTRTLPRKVVNADPARERGVVSLMNTTSLLFCQPRRY